jgi:hypothetical protein
MFLCRNFFLDFDGYGHLSSLEQNFNPSREDVKRKTALGKLLYIIIIIIIIIISLFIVVCVCVCVHACVSGYPQLLSGTLTKLGDVAARHQKVYFPEDMTTRPWQQVGQVKRYRLSFPFYPFRTLCPRELVQSKMLPSPFDASSPLFPAHTQLNITMKRRPGRDFLNFMLPDNLNVLAGTTVGNLTDVQRATATQFRVTTPAVDEDTPAVHVDYRIKSVSVTLVDAYLQVLRIKYKGVSPERPLSNVYTSYRSTFTPLLKVSLHQYPLSWESSARPTAVFISFVK